MKRSIKKSNWFFVISLSILTTFIMIGSQSVAVSNAYGKEGTRAELWNKADLLQKRIIWHKTQLEKTAKELVRLQAVWKATPSYDRYDIERKLGAEAEYYWNILMGLKHLKWKMYLLEQTDLAMDAGGGGGGGNGPCFAPETLVLMADGTAKRIIDIRKGELVKAYDLETGEVVPATVVGTKTGRGDYHYVINGGIRVTPPHPFYSADNRWISIKDLKPGQTVRISCSFATIKSIEKKGATLKIYNIFVKDHHNFFVSADGKEFFLVREGR